MEPTSCPVIFFAYVRPFPQIDELAVLPMGLKIFPEITSQGRHSQSSNLFDDGNGQVRIPASR